MSDPPALERSYRRLLAWYPRAFRREHEEELLAVLLAGAVPGQRRPGLAEAVNLMISGLGARLRRRRVIAGALTCAATIGVLGYILMSPQGYAATAAVLAGQIATDQAHHTTDHRAVAVAVVNLDTEAQLVISQPVAMLAAHLMRSSLPPTQLSSGVTVSVPLNSAVLDITCHAPTAAAAATCADAFAKAYVQTRNRSASWQAHRIGDVIIKPASPA